MALESICRKVAEQLKGQPQKLAKILNFLADNHQQNTECIIVLTLFLNHRRAFRKSVNFLAYDIDQLEQNPAYEIVEIWKLNVPANRAIGTGQVSDLELRRAKKERIELISSSLWVSILVRQDILTPELVSKLLPLYFNGLSLNETVLNVAQKLFGRRYEILAGLGCFVQDAWNNWNRWNNFEISGVRCIKKIVDSFAELAPGIAGCYGGSVFGSTIAQPFGNCIGQLVAGVAGGLASSILAGKLSRSFTRWIFDLPENESREEHVFYALRVQRSIIMMGGIQPLPNII